jgi:hypothetical protein
MKIEKNRHSHNTKIEKNDDVTSSSTIDKSGHTAVDSIKMCFLKMAL